MELVWENGKILMRSLSAGNSSEESNTGSSTTAHHIHLQEEDGHDKATHGRHQCRCQCHCRYGCPEHSQGSFSLSSSTPEPLALMATLDSANNYENKKKKMNTLTKRLKRKRADQVHKLSKKRRRDKINKRLRALHDLIPNCAKRDRVSVLDEAIEYLKFLRLQIQIMSMFAGLGVPLTQMMMPAYYPTVSSSYSVIASTFGMAAGFAGHGTRLQMPITHHRLHQD